MASLSEDLELNISPALASVEQLASALDAAVQAAGAGLADALSTALGSIDPNALTASLTEAVQGADTSLALAPDTGVLESAISTAVAAADTTVTITGDASEVTSEIGSAVEAAPSTVMLNADGTEVTAEGDTAVQAIDPTIVLQADTSQLEAEGNAATQAVFEAQVSNVAAGVGNTQGIIASGAEVAGVTEGVNALTGATRGLEVANAGLEGSVGGVTSAFGPLGVAIAGVTAIGAGFFTEAVNEETAANRLKFVFGDLTDSIQQVNVPANNFNLTMQQIATTTGASLPGLENAASRIGAIGNSAGASGPQIAETSKQILAIATYLAVTNPALGTADQIANQLTSTLQRGGRAASIYGLSLPTKELNAHAQAIAGAGNAVTQFDKIQAGASIVSQQLGTSLGTAVTQGANEAALALPKLTEVLKETVAAVGAPLIGPITRLVTELAPPLEQIATTIGHLLVSAAPLGAVLGIILKVLGDLISVINVVPIPVLTAAVTALGAAFALNAVANFAAGLFTLAANATADVGAIGLLDGAVGALTAELTAADFALGPLLLGLGAAIGSFAGASAALNALPHESQAAADSASLAVAGLTSNTQLATQSASQLVTEQGAVNTKLDETQNRLANLSNVDFIIGRFTGSTRDLQTNVKSLTAESGAINDALKATSAAADGTGGSFLAAGADAKTFGDAVSAAIGKLDDVGAALKTVESANASAISSAVGKLPGVAGVVGDIATAIDTAEKSTASGANAAGNAIATQATHAKDLRDALAGVKTATDALNLLRAGPTAEDAAKAELSVAQAFSTTQSAAQRVLDTEQALEALRAGPTAANAALAQENVSKAILNQEKATLALSDAQARVDQLAKLSGATDRQKQDAQIALQEAQFGLTDATRARTDAEAAQKKLTDDSLAGSKAITTAEQAHTDAVNALEAAQLAQQDAQAKQTKLFADALPGSVAYTAAVQKLADAEDHLTQVENASTRSGSAAAKAKQIDTSNAGILAALSKSFDDTLTLEQKFFDNVGKISGEGGQALVDQLIALGPKQGAAEAAALATATPIVLQGMETKAEKLQDAERLHADQIGTAFGGALDASLIRQFQTELTNEQQFFANVQRIFDEGGAQLAARLTAQGPAQAATLAKAIADGGPTVVKGLESEIDQVSAAQQKLTDENSTLGKSSSALGASIAAGIAKGITSNTSTISGALGVTLTDSLAAANKQIGAKSPSTVFAEGPGRNIALGLALGITDNASVVFASLNDLLASTVEVASGAVSAAKLVGAAGVAIPAASSIAQVLVGPATPSPANSGVPSIVNHFNLPPIQDPNALAFAISTRQATAATR